ncbi:AAA family ATPase [Rhizobiaceae bacterium n13]|uniref:AAA family ATPase n=2 Tax=Ferirhizobium litorale TaxID=2927786 RepID=A0AAE3QEL0_9HYPH|nr:AAA family ATPase [Fererhizobium litorale]MDI7922508.1 AAA family ATPase [Fererhizobium litorale]
MVGSTNLLQLLDIEDYQELIAAFQAAARQAITSSSGIVQLEAGDGGVALFPIELGAKDAASLAIRAGLKIIEACHQVGNEYGRGDLHVRIGIATSVALIHESKAENWTQESVTGAALSMATRLEALAAPDSVLVSEQTRNLAGRSHTFIFQGTKALKGFAEPEKVWRALGHKKEVNRFYAFGRLGGPFVGRVSELSAIKNCWKDVLAGRGDLLWLEGEAGIGKSRLVREIRRITRDQRSRLVFFQCMPGGVRSTLHPLLHSFPDGFSENAVQQRLSASDVATLFARQGIDDPEVVDVFAYLLGATGRNESLSAKDPLAVRDKARQALSKALEAMCREGPIVLIVEDIHWIDPTSRDLLVEAARVLGQFPILLVVTSRPAPQVEWPEEWKLTHISMIPLDAEETRMAIEARWPQHRMAILPELLEVTGRISGGIPLFIEEICQWASENAGTDTIKLSGSASSTHVSVFEGILDARLYQFGSARELARAAAVAGSRFTPALLRALLPDFGKKALALAADTLCETGFLTRVRSHGTIAYSFRHALIQETIYDALLRKQRQGLHRRLFAAVRQDRQIAPWVDTGLLAEHAERAGLIENAVALFIDAGKENASRSAMVEARHHLEHALALCERLAPGTETEVLQLSALVALGPVLTGMVGQNSPPARKLYEDGVAIARRQPRENQPRWFPIYWGWWLTGSDFLVMHDRALQVQVMLSGVDDPEIKLQVKHCIWAIDFNLGRHKETQHAITTGLALYDERSAETARTLFGGHDAKVCALGQLALSLWITGETQQSDEALADMVGFVDRISHVASKAHSLDTEAVSAFYRNDYDHLAAVTKRMGEFAETHEMQSLFGLSLLFSGWAEAHLHNLAAGHDTFRQGLALLRRLGAVIDLPIYLYMHAEMLGLAERYEAAIDVVTDAIKEAKETGHSYWLSELYRCRAVLRMKAGLRKDLAAEDFRTSIAIAERQEATALLQRTRRSIQEFGVVVQL